MPLIYPEFVPNEGPLSSPLWLVGEAPGEQEVKELRPFIGQAGELLMQGLAAHNIPRSDVRLCNLSNYRPYANNFSILTGSYFLQESQERLLREIQEGQPNLIIALGAEALEWLTGKHGISRYRGSLLPCALPGLEHIKVLASFHPSAVLRQSTYYPTFIVDLEKGVRESQTREFPGESFEIHINPTGVELATWEERLIENETSLASDIESTRDASNIICVGYSPDPNNAVVLSTDNLENLKVIARVNESKARKTFHYGTYDRLVQKIAGYEVNNTDFDTYQAQRILNPELPADLGYLTSVYTTIPYYKAEGRAELPGDAKVWGLKKDRKEVYVYNGKDCVATKRIAIEQEKELEERGLRSLFDQCMEQMDMALAMSIRGFPIDIQRKELLRQALIYNWSRYQIGLDGIVMQLDERFRRTGLNVRSTPAMRKLLYETLKFPPRKKKGAKGLDTSEDVIASFMATCEARISELKKPESKREWQIKAAVLQGILQIRELRQLLASYANAGISTDGRMRGIYTVNGTETGRWSGGKFVDNTGFNPQTAPRGGVDIPDPVYNAMAEGKEIPGFSAAAYLAQLTKEDEEDEQESED